MHQGINLPTKISLHVLLILLCLIFIVPLAYIVSISVTGENDIIEHGYRLVPTEITFIAYSHVLNNLSSVLDAYGVSVLVTAFGAGSSLLVTSMLAYAISRRDFALRKYLNRYVLFTMLFSGGLVTFYMLVVNVLEMKDTIWALLLPYLVQPWHVFLMRGFMQELPPALFESAKIDGASELGIFFRIVMPLSKPALATVGLFCAFIYWNDWWLGMLFIDSQSLVPLQLMLYRTMQNVEFAMRNATMIGAGNGYMPTESVRMAICILAAGPMLIVFPFFQKYFVKGLTVGSIKG